MKKIDFKKLIFSLVLPYLAAAIGSFFTAPAINNWYAFLNKPNFNPPSWVFGPTWTILYGLMGIALYLILEKGFENKKIKFAFFLFLGHLALNALWSIIFFGLQDILLALIDIILLWTIIVIIMLYFEKIDKRAAYLLIPYLFWVSFASILNFAIFILN